MRHLVLDCRIHLWDRYLPRGLHALHRETYFHCRRPHPGRLAPRTTLTRCATLSPVGFETIRSFPYGVCTDIEKLKVTAMTTITSISTMASRKPFPPS